MKWRELKALNHFAGGPAERPHGVAAVTLFNLIQNDLIERTERASDFGPELYSLTEKGRAALLNSKISN
jgi:hypothetical protein